MSTDINRLDVILTSRCNLSCGYCFQNAKQDRRMDWETVRAAVDLLLDSRSRDVRLQFFGGEPLLEFASMQRAVAHVAERRRSDARLRRKRVEFSTVTNGTLLDDERADFLVRHDVRTQLSHDGVESAQALRGPGTHARLDRLLRRLRADHPVWFETRLKLNLTVSSANLRHLADSVDYFLELGAANVNLGVLYTHDHGWRSELKDELEAQMERVLAASLRHLRQTGSVPLLLFRREPHESTSAPQGSAMCGAGRGQHLAVDVDGELVGCATWATSYQKFPTAFLADRLSALRLPRVDAPGLPRRLEQFRAAAAATDILARKRDKFSSHGRCAECRHVADCGVCPVSIGLLPGNQDPRRVPDLPCAFNLVTLDCRARFPAVDASLAGRLAGRLAHREARA